MQYTIFVSWLGIVHLARLLVFSLHVVGPDMQQVLPPQHGSVSILYRGPLWIVVLGYSCRQDRTQESPLPCESSCCSLYCCLFLCSRILLLHILQNSNCIQQRWTCNHFLRYSDGNHWGPKACFSWYGSPLFFRSRLCGPCHYGLLHLELEGSESVVFSPWICHPHLLEVRLWFITCVAS